MKISVWLMLTVLFVWGPSVLAVSEVSASPTPDLAVRGVDVMIHQLMDESFKVREQASKDLWELGDEALPALQNAAKSPEPEQALRAREILRKIQLHITPVTDPEVITMVERYAKSTPDQKLSLLSKMMQKRAWRQMLKLYASETKNDIRLKLRPLMNGVAIRAARGALRKGNAREAREFLEMSPVDPSTLLALAEFHRSQGTLQAEIDRAKGIKGEKSQAWQLALQRVAGNIDAARESATAAGEVRIAAAMAALAGDPLPWFLAENESVGRGSLRNDRGEDPFADTEEKGFSSKAYLTAAAKRWKGQALLEKDLMPLATAARSKNPEVSGSAAGELFLLGEVNAAEKAFTKDSFLAAFLYYDTLERIPEALTALGFDPEQLDFTPWVEKRLDKLGKNNIEDQHEVSTDREELVLLANFLERRGLHDEAWKAFEGPLAALAKENADLHMDFIGNLFGSRTSQSGAPLLATRLAKSWAGDDEKRWDEVVAASFGDNDEVVAWWAWLAELNPKATAAERFDGLFAFYSIGGDPSRLREKWLALVWKQVQSMPADEKDRVPLLKRILELGTTSGDVITSLKAWDLLAKDERPENSWAEIIFNLSAAGRWDDCASLILEQIDLIAKSKDDQNPSLHAYAASALRKAGRLEDAAVHDAWVEQLTLGDVQTSIQVGHGYAFGLDFVRAEDWWARAAREADPDDGEIALAFKLHADALLKAGKWKELAGVSEVLTCIYSRAEIQMETPLPVMRIRLQADMARAICMLKADRPAALKILAQCHKVFSRDGSLADFFFPTLRAEGLIKEHDAWFDESWAQMKDVLKCYPGSDNTANTAAWLASRAARKLDEAEKMLEDVLVAKPYQAAYLDTMAEIQFAKGNREKALEWSGQAMNQMPQDSDLRRQHVRFLSAPLPK